MAANQFKNPWQHSQDLAKVARELEKSQETFINHYRQNYTDPFMPPIWAMVETLTLGAMSRWYAATKDNKVKAQVAKALAMPTVEVMQSVLHALTLIRNICAHHARLWNRKMTMQVPNIKKLAGDIQLAPSLNHEGQPVLKADGQIAQQPKRELYNYLLVMLTLIKTINPTSLWPHRLAELIQTATPEQQAAMGFPDEWQAKAIWQGGQA